MTPTGKFLADTPKWAKGLIVAAVIGGVVYVVAKVAKKASGTTMPDVAGDIRKLQNKGQVASYPKGQYDIFANTLKQAFFGYGTDEAAVFGVFSNMKNDIDVAELVKAFGIWQVPCDWWRPFDSCGDGDLAAAMTSELDSDEIKQVNTILANKGIQYRF